MATEVLEGGQYLLQQCIRYSYSNPVRRLRHRLLVVPRSLHGPQALADWHLSTSGSEVQRADTIDAFGNQVVELRAARVEEVVEFCLSALVDVAPSSGPAGLVALGPWPPVDDFARPTKLTVADAAIVDSARHLAGLATSTMDFAERACTWAYQSLRYELGATSVESTAAAARAGGRGVCQDFAHIMLAVCRAGGVPARYVSGHLMGEGGSHAWVEVVVGPCLAVALDPTHDRRAGAGYLTVAVGRDYHDVAPTSGTFSGKGPGKLKVTKRLCYTTEAEQDAC